MPLIQNFGKPDKFLRKLEEKHKQSENYYLAVIKTKNNSEQKKQSIQMKARLWQRATGTVQQTDAE